eukprot:4732485-Lingulodinium_polyedra.AAC.1
MHGIKFSGRLLCLAPRCYVSSTSSVGQAGPATASAPALGISSALRRDVNSAAHGRRGCARPNDCVLC